MTENRLFVCLILVGLLNHGDATAQSPPATGRLKRADSDSHTLTEAEQRALDFILSRFEPGNPLPTSFRIPMGDPWRGDLVNIPLDPFQQIGTHLELRAWIYDGALAAIALAAQAESNPAYLDKAAAILKQIRSFSIEDQSTEPGTIEFSYQTRASDAAPAGSIGDAYLRAGAIAWVGYACTFLLRTPGFENHPDYPEILAFALEIAGFIGDLQVLDPRDAVFASTGESSDDSRFDGSRFGSVKGGRGNYNLLDWTFQEEPVAWVSTEHNIDIYFFLRDLYHVTGDERFGLRAELVRRSLLQNHWHRGEGRFLQGVADPFKALDLYTWGALFLDAVGDPCACAESLLSQVESEGFVVQQDAVTTDTTITGVRNGIEIRDRYNNTYAGEGPFFGVKPYLTIPNDTNWTAYNYFNGSDPEPIPPYPEQPPFPAWPDMIWTEGEAGRALAVGRVRGFGEEFNAMAANLRAIQTLDQHGGLLYSTRTQGSLSFHTWPSIVCSAWQIIALTPIERFWDDDSEVSSLPDPDFVPLTYGTNESRTLQGLTIGAFGNAPGSPPTVTRDSGEHALRFDYDLTESGTYAGVWFEMGTPESPFNPAPFTHIELEIWGTGPAPHVKIDRFVDGISVEGTEHPWPGEPLLTERTLVRIPLATFTDVTPETAVHQLVLVYPHDSSGSAGGLYIDNLAFLRDEDEDHMPEWWEAIQAIDDPGGDADRDSVTNLAEYRHGINPNRCDSDFDGLPDSWELENNLDPADGTGNNGASGDRNRDGQTNLDELFEDQGPASCTNLYLNEGRFKVEAFFRTPRGKTGMGRAVAISGDTGYLWFFNRSNLEMIIKVLDACPVNERFWVFAGGLTNVEVRIAVTDTEKGAVKIYLNSQGEAFRPIQDTSAFATCPPPPSPSMISIPERDRLLEAAAGILGLPLR